MASVTQEEAPALQSASLPMTVLSVPKGYPPVYSDYRLATVEGFWWRGAGGPSANPWLMNPRNLQTGNSPFFGVW